MPVKGRIARISGPLVVAEGMEGAQMFEMVRVGEDKLIGEITRIRGDKAFIQVYESTTGLKPGEPVEGTGAPLSVWLGPGIIGTIYDGVQRPLPLIAEIIAREAPNRKMFIERGVQVDPIPRDKKWHFKPAVNGGGVHVGDKVEPGDVLGTVPETSLIEHRVMVPPGVRGRLKWIAQEGDYTIEDPIAIVEADGKEIEVKMAHRWPVRIPRPYKKKLEPTLPLITGVRIIDTFFPMAKGGTGAVPGGFGTGKCVTPDTPVILEDGTLLTIEDLYNRYSMKGIPEMAEPGETLLNIAHLNIRVLTFDGERIKRGKITHLYKGRSSKLVKIKTRSGREIKVTPIHRLITLDSKGNFIEKPAGLLKEGDQLVLPRKLPITGSPQDLMDYVPGDATVRDPNALEEFRTIIREMINKLGSIKAVAHAIGMNPAALSNVLKGRQYPKLRHYTNLEKIAGTKLATPRKYGYPRSNITVRLPAALDEKLAELLGIIVADGMLTPRELRVFNNNEDLLKRVEKLIKEIFDISPVRKSFRTVKGVAVRSKLVVEFLRNLGIPMGNKAKVAVVPPAVLKSPVSVVGAFIRGYYLGDGTFGKNEIELVTASKQLMTGISYLLSRLGILYTLREKELSKGTYYRIIITGLENLEGFAKQAKLYELESMKMNKVKNLLHYLKTMKKGRLARDSIRIDPSLIAEAASQVNVEKLGLKPTNYTKLGERIGREKLVLLAQASGHRLLKKLSGALEYVFVDDVVKVEVIEGDFTVYDVTVPETHNFVGGEAPSLLHNTVTLHSLAQWSDARVVVYIGCGERGNEMTEVLERFPTYKDPWTGKPLMERTILIANTSNMPVAAREASIYVGVTLAEYYRDMGYDVLLVADSTSRWAEALREIAGRLEEMPAEEGYPSYLASRLAEFYERAGRVEALGSPDRHGSVTIVGAVSPPGGDFTEPVTSHTKRFIRVFWALDTKLAYSRHYPAINWILSYSAYVDLVTDWWHQNVDPRWRRYRDEAMEILTRENELQDIVRLVGTESLDERDKLVLETARLLKDGFLKQNAFDPIDAFATPQKQFKLLRMFIDFYQRALELVQHGITVAQIRQAIGRLYVEMVKAKFTIPNDQLEKIDELRERVLKVLDELEARSG